MKKLSIFAICLMTATGSFQMANAIGAAKTQVTALHQLHLANKSAQQLSPTQGKPLSPAEMAKKEAAIKDIKAKMDFAAKNKNQFSYVSSEYVDSQLIDYLIKKDFEIMDVKGKKILTTRLHEISTLVLEGSEITDRDVEKIINSLNETGIGTVCKAFANCKLINLLKCKNLTVAAFNMIKKAADGGRFLLNTTSGSANKQEGVSIYVDKKFRPTELAGKLSYKGIIFR